MVVVVPRRLKLFTIVFFACRPGAIHEGPLFMSAATLIHSPVIIAEESAVRRFITGCYRSSLCTPALAQKAIIRSISRQPHAIRH